MEIKLTSIEAVTPYPGNPRIAGTAVAKVAESITAFGFRQPIVVDRDGVIIVGHVRYEAALSLGLSEVPVHLAEDLSPEQARAYRLMDNRSHEDAAWDREALALEVAALEAAAEPLVLTGFEDAELRDLLEIELFAGLTDEDEVPDVEPKRVRVSRGDIFVLGPHRVMCGDSTSSADVAALLAGAACQMAFTDPPYNVDVQGAAGSILNDNLEDAAFRELLRLTMRNLSAALEPGGAAYVCHGESEGTNFRRAFAGAGFHLASVLVWLKDSATLSRSDYQWKHEPILYGWKGGGAHNWYGGRSRTTVLEFDRPKSNAVHPTMKPVALVEHCLESSSADGDAVLDLFGGSGSTLIACHKLARKARLMEMDPVYCDAIVSRWEAYCGESARRESDGASFQDIEPHGVA